MRWSVERTLGGSIAIATAAMAIATFFAWSNSLQLTRTAEEIRRTDHLRNSLEGILLAMTEAQDSTRGFVVTGDAGFLDHFYSAGPVVARQMEEVRTLTADVPVDQEQLDRLGTLVTRELQLRTHLIHTAKTQGLDAAARLVATGQGEAEMDALRDVTSRMIAYADRHLAEREAASERRNRRTLGIVAALTILGFATLLASYALTRHHLAVRRRLEAALRERESSLESKVRERTAELEATVAELEGSVAAGYTLQTALKESETRFRRLADASYEGIVLHRSGVLVDVNQTFCRMFGYPREEAVQLRALEFVAPESHDVVRKKMESDDERPYEVILVRKDGTRFFAEVQGRPFTVDGVTFRIAAIRDTTDRKRAEEALARSYAELRRFNELAVGREVRMVELKEEINDLARQLGQPPRYPLAFLPNARVTPSRPRRKSLP